MKDIPKKLLWIDLEMTGLDPETDRILEIGVIVTDWDFNVLSSFETGVGHRHSRIKKLLDRSEFYDRFPANKKALLELTDNSPKESEVETTLIGLVAEHFGAEKVVIAGNSVHVDRQFIRKWMPKFDELLHYRMLDVSAWKLVMGGKFGKFYHKNETHRALDDIKESIAELKYHIKTLRGMKVDHS